MEPEENFADKWNEYPARRSNFMRWLEKVNTAFSQLGQKQSLEEAVEALNAPLGKDVMTKVASSLGLQKSAGMVPITPTFMVAPLGDFAHRQAIPWPILRAQYTASVTGSVHHRRFGKKLWQLGGGIVPKKVWIQFTLKTDVPSPYEVSWQVVNTGREASAERQLRGDFYDSEGSSKNVRWETTKYNGTHWVEAFVIKNGGCVARSGPAYVKVRG